MNASSPTRIAASMLAVIIMMAISAIASPELRAQCNSVAVTNNTGCDLTVCTEPAGNPTCYVTQAHSQSVISLAQNNPIRGVRDFCGNLIPFPNGGCIDQIQIGANCCAKVCFNKTTCTIVATVSANACSCQ